MEKEQHTAKFLNGKYWIRNEYQFNRTRTKTTLWFVPLLAVVFSFIWTRGNETQTCVFEFLPWGQCFLRVDFSIFVPLSRDILWLLRAKVWKTKEYRSTTEWNSCPTVKGSIELFNHWVKSCQTVKSKHQQCWARNVESDCTIVSEMSVSNWKRDQTLKLFPSSESTSMSKASKSSILRKKLQAEKLALKLKIAAQKCEEEISLLRAKAKQRAKLLELKRRAEKTR